MEGDVITMSELFRFDRRGVSADGMVQGELKATGIVPAFHKTLQAKAIDLPMKLFSGNGL
jgi:pilus assembly protein CpaF